MLFLFESALIFFGKLMFMIRRSVCSYVFIIVRNMLILVANKMSSGFLLRMDQDKDHCDSKLPV